MERRLRKALRASKIIVVREDIEHVPPCLIVWIWSFFYIFYLCSSLSLHREKLQLPCPGPIHAEDLHRAGGLFIIIYACTAPLDFTVLMPSRGAAKNYVPASLFLVIIGVATMALPLYSKYIKFSNRSD
jgi:hypothetical protein